MPGKNRRHRVAAIMLALLLILWPLAGLMARAGGGGGRSRSSSHRSSRTYHSTHRPYRSSSHRSGYSGQVSDGALIAILGGGLLLWFIISRFRKKNLPPPTS